VVDQQQSLLRESRKVFFVLLHEQNADHSVRQQNCMQVGLVIYKLSVATPHQGGWCNFLAFAELRVLELDIEWFLSSLGLAFSSFSEHEYIQYPE
jgi:hypothetical protein